MAVRLNDIRARVRQRANQELTGAVGFIAHQELTGFVNASWFKLYNLFVRADGDYFTASTTLTVTSGYTVALPVDFYKLRGVDIPLGNDRFEQLFPYAWQQRGRREGLLGLLPLSGRPRVDYRMIGANLEFAPAANAIGDYRVRYIPRYVKMTPATATIGGVIYEHIKEDQDGTAVTVAHVAGGAGDTAVVTVTGTAISVVIDAAATTKKTVADAVNASSEAKALLYAAPVAPRTGLATTAGATALAAQVNLNANVPDGFEEYIVLDAVIACLGKEESESAHIVTERQIYEAMVADMASDRDAGMPDVVAEVDSGSGW